MNDLDAAVKDAAGDHDQNGGTPSAERDGSAAARAAAGNSNSGSDISGCGGTTATAMTVEEMIAREELLIASLQSEVDGLEKEEEKADRNRKPRDIGGAAADHRKVASRRSTSTLAAHVHTAAATGDAEATSSDGMMATTKKARSQSHSLKRQRKLLEETDSTDGDDPLSLLLDDDEDDGDVSGLFCSVLAANKGSQPAVGASPRRRQVEEKEREEERRRRLLYYRDIQASVSGFRFTDVNLRRRGSSRKRARRRKQHKQKQQHGGSQETAAAGGGELSASETSPEESASCSSGYCQKAPPSLASTYELRGYFVDNPEIRAKIVVGFEATTAASCSFALKGKPESAASPGKKRESSDDRSAAGEAAHHAGSSTRIASTTYEILGPNSDSVAANGCEVEEAADEDWTWLPEELERHHRSTLSGAAAGGGGGEAVTPLALWLQRIGDYVRFDRRRRDFLERSRRQCLVASVAQNRSKTTIEIPLVRCLGEDGRGAVPASASAAAVSGPIDGEEMSTVARNGTADVAEEGDANTTAKIPTLSLVWGWSWKEGRDVLRLTQVSSELGLDQNDLNQLVSVCSSCERALEAIFPKLSGDIQEDWGEEGAGDSSSAKAYDGEEKFAMVNIDADDEESDYCDEDEEEEENEEDMEEQDSESSSSSVERELSEYELARLERIKRNEAYLAKLGLHHTATTVKNGGRKNGTNGRKRKRPGRKKNGAKQQNNRRTATRESKRPKPSSTVERRTSSRLRGDVEVHDDLFY